MKTEIAFHAKDKKVDLVINGEMKSLFFNYSFISLADTKANIYGVMNTGTDVTDLHQAKQEVQNSDERLRMAIESSSNRYVRNRPCHKENNNLRKF